MKQSDWNKLKQIRQLLKEAYDHYFEFSEDGHCKSSEGHISIDFGNYWEDKNCELKITGVNIYSYVLGPSRSHYFKDLDTALDTVVQWHSEQMKTDYNELYDQPESFIQDDFYLENPDA